MEIYLAIIIPVGIARTANPVHEKKCIGCIKCIYEMEYLINLYFACDESCVDTVEMLSHFLPFLAVNIHFICVVIEVIVWKAFLSAW